ncbi:MAG: hypothetical protein KKA16_02840 [Alphaproteobacteria bacterium]|nr:hypothetical protein [Alphaproteobacteria bacterium]MBU2378541.1 hypothetical protein [Alphaproteobacteria bacterium]
MLLVSGLMAAILALMLAFPHTGVGRLLKRWLVDAPAHALNRVRPGKIVFYIALAALGTALTLLFEADGIRLFGMMLPETLVWFAMFDVGVFIDALLITTAILASNGLSVARTRLATASRRIAAAAASRRTARSRRPRKPAKRPPGKTADDDDAGWPVQPPYLAFSIA